MSIPQTSVFDDFQNYIFTDQGILKFQGLNFYKRSFTCEICEIYNYPSKICMYPFNIICFNAYLVLLTYASYTYVRRCAKSILMVDMSL